MRKELKPKLVGLASNASPTAFRPEIVVIYFPGYHRDMHYDAWFGYGWNEWQLVKKAKKRFPGHWHFQSAWGDFDEANPRWMEKQIDLASRHGVDVFIFDWYWYSGVKILHRPLEEGFLKSRNRKKLKYALMWANHEWRNWFPVPLNHEPELYLPIRHSAEDFENVITHCIETHFCQSNYWRVDGRLYYSFFQPDLFVDQLGGEKKAKKVIEHSRLLVKKAGLGKLHFGGFIGASWVNQKLKNSGFDSVTSYHCPSSGKAILPEKPLDEYDNLIERHAESWKELDNGILPYAPVVTVGCDPSPRWPDALPYPPTKDGYPYTTIVVHNTPQKFGELCKRAKKYYQSQKLKSPGIFVNTWNEWTEGSVLLPDKKYKIRYLEELKKGFNKK